MTKNFFAVVLVSVAMLSAAPAQTDCNAGNGLLDFTPPKSSAVSEIIQKFTAAESAVKEARTHYSYTQDVLVQTLNGTAVDGQFHEVTTVSYDSKGRRQENVTFAEQSTLRRAQLSAEDMDDVRVFMPFIMTADEAP